MKEQEEQKQQEQKQFTTENYEVFTLVTEVDENENSTTKIVIGQYFIKQFETIEQAKKYIDQKPYEIIMALCGIMCEHIINKKQN